MFVLGLTGSAAMGKSTAATMFRRLGVPVFDADAAVHALLGSGGSAVGAIEAEFPGVVRAGEVDRTALGRRVFDDPGALERLETIVHPLVQAEQGNFLRRAARERRRLVVLDIPLLFETGAERACDAVAVVSAPARVQMQRLLARPGIDRPRAEAILARQMPDSQKRRRADYVIHTGLGKNATFRAIRRLVNTCRDSASSRCACRRARPVDRLRRRS